MRKGLVPGLRSGERASVGLGLREGDWVLGWPSFGDCPGFRAGI